MRDFEKILADILDLPYEERAELAARILDSLDRERRGSVDRFLIVVENLGANYSAYSPDLPGCVATGATREETEANMYEAIRLHIDGLREDGLPIPSSDAIAEYVVVGA